MIVSDFLKYSAERNPGKTAVVYHEKRLSYSDLHKLSDICACCLMEKGISIGDRVAIFLDNCPEYLISYFGILKCGGVVVALNSQLLLEELLLPLNDCQPRIIITNTKHAKIVENARNNCSFSLEIVNVESDEFLNKEERLKQESFPLISEESLAMIIYTSGTTGKPKGVMLSHGNLSANADSIIEYLKLTEKDRVMVVIPFFYSYGNSLLTTHIKCGGTLVVDNRFVYPNVVLDTMYREKVTGFAGVPSHFAILLRKSAISNYSFLDLRYVTQAGGAMMPEAIKEFKKILPEVDFYVMYGQTEASARLSYLEPEMLYKKSGSVGKAIPGVLLDIVDEKGITVTPGEVGEIVAAGKNIMQGYWNDAEETKKVLKNRRLFTGDLASFDDEGYIYIKSRKKIMIKSGANRISPFEIEEIINKYPGIIESAAVGAPDDILGEVVRLFVVLEDDSIIDRDIMIYCKNNLSFYKVPKSIEFIPELPKTSSGKIKRGELKERRVKPGGDE